MESLAEIIEDGTYMNGTIKTITNIDIPDILLNNTWKYYVIGGRAYNLLMKQPVYTLDYDIKFHYDDINIVKEIRDIMILHLSEKYPHIKFVAIDHDVLFRIVAYIGNTSYEIVDCGIIDEGFVNSKYNIHENYIIGPNGLRYGGLGYLMGRLEELTEIRGNDVKTIEAEQANYYHIKSNMDTTLSYLRNNTFVDSLLVDKLNKLVTDFGKSAESDFIIARDIPRVITEISDILIDTYDLESEDEFIDFLQDEDIRKWAEINRRKGLDLENPADVVILLYLAEDVYRSSGAINVDISEKIDKYLRTQRRLQNMYKGLTNPYTYYSTFFVEYLAVRCEENKTVKMFLTDNFMCMSIAKSR